MLKNKKIISIISIVGLMYLPFIPLAGQEGSANNNLIKIEKRIVVRKTIEENIQYMQNKLPELIKKMGLENKEEVIIDMGPLHKPGSRTSYVHVDKVRFKINGETLSEIGFITSEALETGYYKEERELVNKGPSNESCKDLKVVYRNSKGAHEEFSLDTLQNDVQKTRVLRVYLENLETFVRWMTFYVKKGTVDQDKVVKKALLVG